MDENLIKGCQSRVWLAKRGDDGQVVFTADSDAIITKGLAALMVRVLSDAPAADIASAKLSFLDDRVAQPPEPHTQQRPAIHGEADEAVRLGVHCKCVIVSKNIL